MGERDRRKRMGEKEVNKERKRIGDREREREREIVKKEERERKRDKKDHGQSQDPASPLLQIFLIYSLPYSTHSFFSPCFFITMASISPVVYSCLRADSIRCNCDSAS